MSSRMPPRYLPTLTEVVDPKTVEGLVPPHPAPAVAVVAPPTGVSREPSLDSLPAAMTRQENAPAVVPAHPYAGPPGTAVPDKHALAQQLIKLVKPQLEAELRNIAQELFEAQFSALLPSMHLHIEEAVREAIEQALPDPPDAGYGRI